MNTYAAILCALWGLCAAGLAWYSLSVARQITYVTLADGRRKERKLPLVFRLLLPLAPNLFPLCHRPVLRRARESIDKRITAAGFEGLLAPEEFLALRVLLPVILGAFWVLFVLLCISANPLPVIEKMKIPLCLLGPLCLYIYPQNWLRKAVAGRHNRIRRSLPFVLDLLTLSVEAGLDFMTALQRNVERGEVDELGEELLRVIREIQLGATRREALRAMSRRVDFSDLRSVINALVQADELGVSIGAILRIQADQVRQRRFERAERLAHQAPVKMLFPLMAFIFPAVFLILLGPVVYRLIQQGF